jgi:hypothetical protein
VLGGRVETNLSGRSLGFNLCHGEQCAGESPESGEVEEVLKWWSAIGRGVEELKG